MRLRSLWGHPAFRSLWLAGFVSDTGDWLLFIALPIVVYQLTGSAFGTSLAFLVELLPGIVLAPLAGWCADRWDRRRVLVVVCCLQAFALVPLLVVHARAQLPLIYAVILVEAALTTLFEPAKNALVPSLVRAGDLVSANSVIGLGQNLARLAGGPLGGVLLAAGGLRIVVTADLISYLVAAVIIGRIAASASNQATVPHDRRRLPGRGAYQSMLRSRRLRGALLATLVSQIAQGIFVVLFILFVAQRLHGTVSEIGLLRGVQAVGAIAGGVILVVIARRYSPGTLAAGAAIAFGAVDLVVWNASLLSTNTALYVGLFIVIGAPGIVLGTGLISALQLDTHDTNRGRVIGAFGLTSNLGQAVGMVAAGLLAAPLGLLSILNTQAVLYLAAGGIAAWLMTDDPVRARLASQRCVRHRKHTPALTPRRGIE